MKTFRHTLYLCPVMVVADREYSKSHLSSIIGNNRLLFKGEDKYDWYPVVSDELSEILCDRSPIDKMAFVPDIMLLEQIKIHKDKMLAKSELLKRDLWKFTFDVILASVVMLSIAILGLIIF